MASTATINSWIDQLATSILPKSKLVNRRRQTETFRRRIRNHPYGRTNQFDVKERLDGLEEKFQILNRDDLSDTLYQRRLELREHEPQWLPDALDLLLRLSNDPIGRTNPVALHEIEPKSLTPSVLKWTDPVSADESFDKDDPIWKQPDWSDLSSEEDEVEISTAKTSPQSVKKHKTTSKEDHQIITTLIYESDENSDFEPPLSLIPERSTNEPDSEIVINEIQLVRETLLMVQGYPSSLFLETKHGFRLDSRLTLREVNASVPGRLLQSVTVIRTQIHMIRKWLEKDVSSDFLESIHQDISTVLQGYLIKINQFAQAITQPQQTSVVTLLGTVSFIEESALRLKTVASYVQHVYRDDDTSCLERLYELLCHHYFCCNETGMAILMPIFTRALDLYLRPIIIWLNSGKIDKTDRPFFVQQSTQSPDPSTMWYAGQVCNLDGPYKPPAFLLSVAQDIFICGKTSEFLLSLQPTRRTDVLIHCETLVQEVQRLAQDSFIPFPAAFSSLLSQTIESALHERTLALKQVLNNQCGLNRCLDAFDQIYLCKNGVVTENLETKIFKRIDRCQDNWNDRFLVADILEDVCIDISCIDMDSIAVQSIHTSSRSMESRRRSVKIMGALAIEYTVPWPVANIIPKASMTTYRRVALHLAQLRRTKYVLERIAFPTACSNTIAERPIDQKFVQAFTFILITFVNTMYDHFSMGVIDPLTNNMRQNLHSAPTVDEMISVHRSYTSKLQQACLLTKNYTVLRDTMTGLLDMCIRFADLVTSATTPTTEKKPSDFETSSFTSAQSTTRRDRRRARRQQRQKSRNQAKHQPQNDNDILPSSSSSSSSSESSVDDTDTSTDDDDDALLSSGEGEGYSSFIVLDENTTVVLEIRKLHVQFTRQLDFFVAGLRGSSKAGDGDGDGRRGETVGVEDLNVLAERLTWKGGRDGMRRVG